MTKLLERGEALKLRRIGYGISEIATKLGISKSTASYWCRDVILSPKARGRLQRASKTKSISGILKHTESLRRQRLERTAQDTIRGTGRFRTISNRDIFCVGIGLYWGEGYKRGSQEFGFTNSDPIMIKFYILWLRVVFGIPKQDLILRVSINNQHSYRIGEVQRYWSKVTATSIKQFSKPSLIKTLSKKHYKNKKDHFGTLRIKVRRGTRLRREVLGSISGLAQHIND